VTRPNTAQITTQTELNVVQRAAAALNTVFRDRGFVAKTSRKRLQSAASVLLNGLEDKQIIEAETVGYAATPKPTATVVADIDYARSYVDRTVSAAEIYLEIAPEGRDIRAELSSLEKALLASNEAHDVFEQALNGDAKSKLLEFETSVTKLRMITDKFGVYVRDVAQVQSRGVSSAS